MIAKFKKCLELFAPPLWVSMIILLLLVPLSAHYAQFSDNVSFLFHISQLLQEIAPVFVVITMVCIGTGLALAIIEKIGLAKIPDVGRIALIVSTALFALCFLIFAGSLNTEDMLTSAASSVVISFVAAIISFILLNRYQKLSELSRGGIIIPVVIIFSVIVLWRLSHKVTDSSKGAPQVSLSQQRPVAEGPNIILIVLDTVRADYISAYGVMSETTPNIDKFAADSTLFSDAMATSPWTLPSHATLFTGYYTAQHQTSGEHYWLADSFTTLAESLADTGYLTVSVFTNQWLGPAVNMTQGFDAVWQKEWLDKSTKPADEPTPRQVLRKLYLPLRGARKTGVTEGLPQPPPEYEAARTNRAFLNFLDINSDRDRPFFALINYMEAHSPYVPQTADAKKFLTEQQLQQSYQIKLRNPSFDQDYYPQKYGYTEDDFRLIRKLYQAELYAIDRYIGRLMDELKQRDLYDDTLIIITSDHGEYLGEHNRLRHTVGLHRAVTWVPLLVRYPKLFKPGSSVAAPVNLIDVYHTVLDIAGVEARPRGIDNPVLLYQAGERPDQKLYGENYFPTFWAVNGFDLHEDLRHWFVESKYIQQGNYRYIWKSRGGDLLYDIKSDPGETQNLIDSNPELARKMKSELWKWFDGIYQPPFTDNVAGQNPDARGADLNLEKLKELGYIK